MSDPLEARRKIDLSPFLLLAYAVWGLVFWVDRQWRPEWDSALYLLTGKALAEGDGYTYLGQPFFLRPPGLAWLLSWAVDDGAYDFHALNRMVMLFAGATLGAVYFALRGPHGRWRAIAIALLVGTCPLFVDLFNWVMSDLPFAALLFGAIALLERAGRRGDRWWAWAAGGVAALTGAIYLRAAGILMLPGMVLLGLRRDRGVSRWRALAPPLLVLLLTLPWWVHADRSASEAPRPSEQLLNFDYATALLHVDPGDPDSALVPAAGWLERVRGNAGSLLSDLSATCLGSEAPWAAAILAGLVLCGFAAAVRHGPTLLEWLSVTYLPVLLVYFTYDRRLVLPLVPLVYLYLLRACSALATWSGRRLGREHLDKVACAALFVLLLGLNVAGLPASLRAGQEPFGPVTRGEWWEAHRSIGKWIRENTPDDAVILCNEAPVLSVLGQRRAYSYRHARDTRLLERYAPDYVVLYPVAPTLLSEQVTRAAVEEQAIPVGSGSVPIYRLSP